MADRNIPFCDEPGCDEPAEERFVGLQTKKPLDLCKKHMRRFRSLAGTVARKPKRQPDPAFACEEQDCDFVGFNDQSLRFHQIRKHGYRKDEGTKAA